MSAEAELKKKQFIDYMVGQFLAGKISSHQGINVRLGLAKDYGTVKELRRAFLKKAKSDREVMETIKKDPKLRKAFSQLERVGKKKKSASRARRRKR